MTLNYNGRDVKLILRNDSELVYTKSCTVKLRNERSLKTLKYCTVAVRHTYCPSRGRVRNKITLPHRRRAPKSLYAK